MDLELLTFILFRFLGLDRESLRQSQHDRGTILVGNESAEISTSLVDFFQILGIHNRHRHWNGTNSPETYDLLVEIAESDCTD